MSIHNLEVAVKAPGKVNLYLAVGPVREDGYHPLSTLFAAVSLAETVTVRAGERPGIELSMSVVPGSLVGQQLEAGEFNPAQVPLDERNLAHAAAAAVLREHGLTESTSLHLHIDKAVPVAGGMAGGSADAAAALIATDRYLHAAGLTPRLLVREEYERLGASLGADVPFSVRAALGDPLAVGAGTGTELVSVPAPANPLHLVVVAARFGLSTPSVFAELDSGRASERYPAPGPLEPPRELLGGLAAHDGTAESTARIGALLRNDLQGPALSLAPQLGQTLGLSERAGVAASLVSGSGPTVLLLARSAEEAEALAASLSVAEHHAVPATVAAP